MKFTSEIKTEVQTKTIQVEKEILHITIPVTVDFLNFLNAIGQIPNHTAAEILSQHGYVSLCKFYNAVYNVLCDNPEFITKNNETWKLKN